MTTSFGPVREVMFAPTSDVTDVNTFLIRDDAYAKSSAVLGRTLRLGDPIDTGVVSAAYQTSWTGGRDQTSFSDTSMFLDSTLDTTDPSGRIKMWPGITPIGRGGAEFATSIISSSKGTNFTNNSIVFSMNSGNVFQALVDTPFTQTGLTNFSPDVPTVMCQLDQTGSNASEWIAIGFTNGNYKIVQTTSGTIQDRSHPDPAKRAKVLDIVSYRRKMAVMMGTVLWTVDYNGTSVVWTEVVSFNQATAEAASLAVVGDTLYILISYRGGRCALFASDGTSGATLLYTFENSYPVKLHSFKGGLYIHVNEFAFTQDSIAISKLNTALYSYSGGSMRKLYSRSDSFQYFINATSNGPSCVWNDYIALSYYSLPKTFNSTTEDRTVGFLLYDPVNDSFHAGPSLKGLPANTTIKAMNQSNGALYFNMTDGVDNVLCATNRNKIVSKWGWGGSYPISLGIKTTSQKHKLISSSFDAGFPDQQKTWLRVNIKHNLQQGTSPVIADNIPTMNVYVRTSSNDYDSTEYLIGTYSPGVSDSGWRTTSFDIAWTGTKFPKSNQLRYVVELAIPFNPANEDGAIFVERAIIDSVSVEYMLVATPKKVWRARVLCEDEQLKLSNTANVLNTRQELVDKLFEYWENGQPLYYWDASSSTVTPSSVNYDHIVMITDIGENSYRIDSNGEEVNSEVSLTMYEVA